MPRPIVVQLDDHRSDIVDKLLAGQTEKQVLASLNEKGIRCSDSSLKRKIKTWRAEKTLPPGRERHNYEELHKAVLALCQNPAYMPTDEELVEAVKDRFQTTPRAIKRIRITNGLRRRERTANFEPSEDLIAAVILRLTDPDMRLRDDELAEEMNKNGFNTCAKEILSIRQKNKIRHPCRGANRYSKHRRITQEPRPEAEVERDTDSEEEEIAPPPLPKLVQDHHLTVVDFDPKALEIFQQLIEPIRKLIYDRLRPGVRICRDPKKAAAIARPLLDNLMAGECKVTAMYVSNNILIPDALFGCWLIPVDFHRERERIDDEIINDGVEEEVEENFIDDISMKLGQALYVSKQVPVHCRMTGLLLHR